jgi:Transposase
MKSMPAAATPVTVGVDTHLETHVAAVIDQTGRLLGTQAFPASTRGYVALITWAEGFGPVAHVGVEGTGTFGAGLTRFVRAYGPALLFLLRSQSIVPALVLPVRSASPAAPFRSRGTADVSGSGSSRADSRRTGSRACTGSPAAAWRSPPFRRLAGVGAALGAPPVGRGGDRFGVRAARVGPVLQQPGQVSLQGAEPLQLGADLDQPLAQ